MSQSENLKKFFNQWGGSTGLFFSYVHFSHDVCGALLVPLLPLIRTDFGLNYLQSGMLISAYNVASAFSQFLGGWLGGRFRLQIIAALGVGGVGLSTLVTGFSPAYYPLLFLLIVMGIFSGGYHPAANSMLPTYFEASRRGKIVGLHMLGGTLAMVVAPVVGGLIADRLNWNFAFIILSFPAILASIMIFLVLKKVQQQEKSGLAESKNPTSPTDKSTAKATPRRTDIWHVWQPIMAIMVLTLLSQIVAGAALAFIPMYFVDKAKVAVVTAAMFLGTLRVGGLPGGLFGGWLADRWGGRKTVVLALAVTGPMLFLITILPVSPFLLIALGILGAIIMVRQTAVQTFLMDNTPPQIRSTVFGIYFGFVHQASSVAQPVVGYFMDIYGITRGFTFVALISVALSLAALVLLRPRHKPSA